MKKLLLTVFLCSACFSTSSAQDYKNKLESSNEYIIAKITYQQGKYNKSYQMFDLLFKKYSDNAMVNYYYAMSAIALKKEDIAMAALQRVLIKEPNFNQARVEYGKLLFEKGFKKESKKEFEKVLISPLPVNVRKNIEKYIKAIDSENKNRFMATIGFNFFYDSNLNNSFDSVISIPQSGNFTSKKDDAYGGALFTQLSLLSPIDEGYTFNNSLVAYKKANIDQEGYDMSFFSYKPSLIINSSSTSAYFVDLSIDKFISGDNKNFIAYGGSLKYKKILDKNFNVMGGYSLKKYDYKDDKDLSFYSNKLFVSASYLYFKYDGSFSINIDTDEKSRTDIDRNILENKISLDYKIKKDTKILADYTHTNSYYDDVDTIYNKEREDTKHSFNVGLSKSYSKDSIVTLSVNYIRNVSNIPIYSYEKQLVNVGYIRNFRW